MEGYIATIGSKVTAEVKMVNIFEYQDYKFSYYGTSRYIYTMQDNEGNVLVYKSGAYLTFKTGEKDRWGNPVETGIRRGDKIIISGTVKDHGEYKGTKQTVLQRVRVKALIERQPTKQELETMKREEQLASLTDGDFCWRMPYRQYKEHYSDCEVLAGSFNDGCDSRGRKIAETTVEVIIREGRLKNSGVRGNHFYGFEFRTADGGLVCYRAVSEENARKRMLKDYPESGNWECTRIYTHRTREFT